MSFVRIFIILLCLTFSTSLHLGDECVESISGLGGKCQNLWECTYTLKQRKMPEYCDDSSASSVCCPPIQLRISEKMCLKYYTKKDVELDGVQVDNVPVGTKDLRKINHLALIGFTQGNKIIWGCGGSIISPFFILSSAHCNKHEKLGSAKWVRIGELLRQELYPEDVNLKNFRIVDTFMYFNYTSSSHYNDIALFKLEKEIIFGDDFQPACLHTTRNVPEIMEVTWGHYGHSNALGIIKGKIVIQYEKCAQKYRHNRKLPKGVIDKLQICALGGVSGEACRDKFEGPLQYKYEEFGNVRGHYVLAGIASFGEKCRYDYNTVVYTRISAYLTWIEQIVWGNEDEPEIVTFVFRN